MLLSDSKATGFKHVCLFGEPKSGKTMLAGQLAEFGFNLKWFDLENGANTLRSSLSPEAQARIELYTIPDTRVFPVAAATIMEVLKGQHKRICHAHGAVSCSVCLKSTPNDFSVIELNKLGPLDIVVLDSGTQWSNSIMAHIGRTQPDDWKPEWDHFRQQGTTLDRGLGLIQNGRFNFIYITHVASIPQEDGKERLIPVSGTTNFSRNTAKYFDEVIYCEVKNRRHVAASTTTYAPNVLTGSRTGVELEKDPLPSLIRIFKGQAGNSQVAKMQEDLLKIKEMMK